MDFRLLKEEFPNILINSNKIEIDKNVLGLLKFLKICPEYSFNVLLCIIAVDYLEYIELVYPMLSTIFDERLYVSIKVNTDAQSVISIFPNAYFDECEIYDLFGIKFTNNQNLKRLFMPKSWIGYPLKKNYSLNDERLVWNG